ncbi:ATP-binding protein [Streptomyces flaveolus]|uniref:ATP-binding protein n=1 Tax=Streptomyces flaveolus TaxID=67297 RepID=UPI00342ECAFF
MLDPCASTPRTPLQYAAEPGYRPDAHEHARLAQLVMAAEGRLVPEARAFADVSLRHLCGPELVDNVRIVVGELIANAIVHSGTDSVTLTLDSDGLCVLVAVTDFGIWQEAAVAECEMAESGRGLVIVEALSTTRGICKGPSGTCAWATVADPDTLGASGRAPAPARAAPEVGQGGVHAPGP